MRPLLAPPTPPIAALTIAGSDSGGGAGIQADLRTFFAHGILGCTAITAVTAQNTMGVRGFEALSAALVRAQIEAVLDDLPVRAAKTGMLAHAGLIAEVADVWRARARVPLVVDPVMVSTSGHRLIADDAIATLRASLLPLAAVVTPNLAEAAVLLDRDPLGDPDLAVAALAALAPSAAIVLKGGHGNDPREAIDLVRMPDGTTFALRAPRVATRATHGTGCTLAAAITAALARGQGIVEALHSAKGYLAGALAHATPIGGGHGPVDHLWALREALGDA